MEQFIGAPRAAVYRALLDPQAIAQWRVPDGMHCEVHAFDAREGGVFRISLTYTDTQAQGKTQAHTDTYHGHFATLLPDEKVVEMIEFESADPAMQGEFTVTTTLAAAHGGTLVSMRYQGLPRGVPAEDNAAGTRMALAKLSELVAAGASSGG